jgi:hypothetical protein
MNDLMEKFAEARFGKQAFLGKLFGGLDPKKRAIRDRIEDMIREERRKRKLAQEAIEYGKYRLTAARKPSTLGWVADISRAAIPGLSISAARAVDGLVKKAQDPDKGWGGRLFDLAHLGAAGAGGGLGYAAATGKLSDIGTATRMARTLGDPLSGKLTKVLGKGMEHVGAKYPEQLALAASDPGRFSRILSKLTPTYWWRRATGGAATPEAARSFIASQLTQAGKTPEAASTAIDKLKGMLRPAVQKLTGLGAGKKRIKLPGKWGAIIGALAVSAPFIAARLYKTRKLRAAGGTAGQAAVRKAETLLGDVGRLRKEREALMQQLG